MIKYKLIWLEGLHLAVANIPQHERFWLVFNGYDEFYTPLLEMLNARHVGKD